MANRNRPVALVTGASKGLGYTLASFLAAQGYDLIVAARGSADLNRAAENFAALGAAVKAVAGDVQEDTFRQAITEAVQAFGRLDLLINNASTLGPLPMPALASYPPDALNEVFAINAVAPLALTQAVLPFLRASQGLVVNVSSDAAVGGYEGWGGYGASKAALDLLSRTLANELRSEQIAVVSVDPGDMRTDMHQNAYPGEDITDLPLPEVTIPFWAWLFGQDRQAVTGQRFQAQSELWEVRS